MRERHCGQKLRLVLRWKLSNDLSPAILRLYRPKKVVQHLPDVTRPATDPPTSYCETTNQGCREGSVDPSEGQKLCRPPDQQWCCLDIDICPTHLDKNNTCIAPFNNPLVDLSPQEAVELRNVATRTASSTSGPLTISLAPDASSYVFSRQLQGTTSTRTGLLSASAAQDTSHPTTITASAERVGTAEDGNTLSDGAIAGIAIGVAAATAALLIGAFLVIRRRRATALRSSVPVPAPAYREVVEMGGRNGEVRVDPKLATPEVDGASRFHELSSSDAFGLHGGRTMSREG